MIKILIRFLKSFFENLYLYVMMGGLYERFDDDENNDDDDVDGDEDDDDDDDDKENGDDGC